MLKESATFDHFRKISFSSSRLPSAFSFVAIGVTTAAMAMTNSIKYTIKLFAIT